jgi:predicted DNA-binding transcriptional regulator
VSFGSGTSIGSKNELGAIDLQLKKMALVAPFDGVILKRSKNPGAVVSFGDPVYILSDPNQTWIETEIADKTLGSINVGTVARIRLAAYPKKEFLGKVSYIGPATVAKLKENTGLHRTTIYDFVEKLLNKGLINYVIEGQVKVFSATNPQKLLDYVKEKAEHVESALSELKKMRLPEEEELAVEVYRGREGVKMMFNDILRVAKDYVIFGIDESMFVKDWNVFLENFFVKEKKAGFHERILTRDDAEYVYDKETVHYRFIPKEYFNPNPTYVWGDNVGIIIWEPLTVIRIRNAKLADSYLKYFELLWSMAEEWPRSKWPGKNQKIYKP